MTLVLETPQRNQNTLDSFTLLHSLHNLVFESIFFTSFIVSHVELLLFNNTVTFSKADARSHSSSVAPTYLSIVLGT